MVKTSEITSQNKRHELENLYFNVIQNDDALDESDSSGYSTPKIIEEYNNDHNDKGHARSRSSDLIKVSNYSTL